jgi:UDP-N-acetylglucosamine--N-acetylmuramyl-(pentapeptide) pyrophosphoryl-undecaprenol N-acetylglucosamine transferase
MFIGQLLSIPTIVYEQNSFFGKSNKFFAKKAILIALAYKSTQNLPTNYSDKILITGDFVRDKIKNLPEKSSFSNKPFNLLVFGGSQGAKIFSSLVPEAIKILLTKYPETEIRIVQQVLENDKERVKKAYDNLKIQSTISDFFHDIYKQYENSHLVIARAGATTIAELTQIGLPAIFIPLPSSADDHQYYNAKSLQDSNCSWYYRQEEVTAEVLANKLHSLIDTPSIIKEASLNLLKRKTDGTKHLANTVLKIIT